MEDKYKNVVKKIMKEKNNSVCLYFNSEFTGSNFLGDTFEIQGNINMYII